MTLIKPIIGLALGLTLASAQAGETIRVDGGLIRSAF